MIKKSLFYQSFKRVDKNILFIILLDIIFFLSVALIITFSVSILSDAITSLNKLSTFLNNLQSDSINFDDPAQTEQLEKEVSDAITVFKSSFVKISLTVAAAGILFFLLSIFIKGAVWCRSKGEAVKFRLFWKYIKFRTVWYFLWIFALPILFFVKRELIGFYLIMIGIIFLYFNFISLAVFNSEKKKFYMIRKTISLGVKRFYILFFIVFLPFVVVGALYFVMMPLIIRSITLMIIYAIAAIFVIAWQRIYLSSVVHHYLERK